MGASASLSAPEQLRLSVPAKLVAGSTECREPCRFRSRNPRWVSYRPVPAVSGTQEERAGFIGLVTNGDELIEYVVFELLQRLGFLAGDIDSQLSHDRDRLRLH